MKALTLKPEFANMVLSGKKIIENRSWGNHNNLKGQRIAIHRGGKDGALICTVVIKAIISEEIARRLFPKQESHICGPLCWVLTDLQPIKPVPCKGKLSLWDLPEDIDLVPLPKKR